MTAAQIENADELTAAMAGIAGGRSSRQSGAAPSSAQNSSVPRGRLSRGRSPASRPETGERRAGRRSITEAHHPLAPRTPEPTAAEIDQFVE